METDELLRRPVTGGAAKTKRKPDSADLTENDGSFVAFSAKCSIVRRSNCVKIRRLHFYT